MTTTATRVPDHAAIGNWFANGSRDETDVLDEATFSRIRQLMYQRAGISLAASKKLMVISRLSRRLRHYGLKSYADYYRLISQQPAEMQTAVDLLTTNETHFFREPKHFDWLRDRVLPAHPAGRELRIWSAASSSGEEAYSLAMLLGDQRRQAPWQIFGSDISTRVLAQARAGIYDMDRAHEIPPHYLKRYCLRGVGGKTGKFLIDPALRQRARFEQINLNESLPDVGQFDVIFLRNVLIYFKNETKAQVVDRLSRHLRPGGWLMVGHSESLNGTGHGLRSHAPSIYQKIGVTS